MIQVLLGKWILKKGGIPVLLMVGDLIVKTTKSKKDDEMWSKVKPIIEAFKQYFFKIKKDPSNDVIISQLITEKEKSFQLIWSKTNLANLK